MSEWGSGYVTDTAYVHDFCRVQTPTILSFAALAKSVAARLSAAGHKGDFCPLVVRRQRIHRWSHIVPTKTRGRIWTSSITGSVSHAGVGG
jgi:hypothetical protein